MLLWAWRSSKTASGVEESKHAGRREQRHYETERRSAREVSEERGARVARAQTQKQARRLGARAVVERPAPREGPRGLEHYCHKRQRRVARLIARPAGPDGVRADGDRGGASSRFRRHEGVFGDSRLGPREGPRQRRERHKCSEGARFIGEEERGAARCDRRPRRRELLL